MLAERDELMTTTITGTDLVVTVNGHAILQVPSVQANPGSILALTGISGSGKTTLLNVLGLLISPGGGVLKINGRNIARWSDLKKQKFWREQAVFIFQDYGLIDEETVAYNLTLTRFRFGRRRRAAVANNVESVLNKVCMSGRSSDLVASLSGGEKQRIGFARALYREAKVVLADEPTASLDKDNQQLVLGLLRNEADRGATVIVSTHDSEVVKACDDVLEVHKPS